MSIKISELPQATAVNAADMLCIVQDNDTKQAAAALLPYPVEVPPGSLIMFAGSVAPAGWLLCDGSLISRSTYAALFAVVGTTYGAGDGSTTFKLPDLRGRARLGAGQGDGLTARTLGAVGGEEGHANTADENGPHSHRLFSKPSRYNAGTAYGDFGGAGVLTSESTDTSGLGTLHNTMMPFAVLNFIIKI